MVSITAGEAYRPFKDVPVAMSFVYIVPLSIYPFAMIAAGASVNYADPHLPKQWSRGNGPMAQSPFVIAVQNSSLHGLPRALNAFFVMSAYTAASVPPYSLREISLKVFPATDYRSRNTALYAASRTVFTLAQQYAPPGSRVARWFGRTNRGNTPLAAVGLCSALGLLSLIGLSQYAYSQVRRICQVSKNRNWTQC